MILNWNGLRFIKGFHVRIVVEPFATRKRISRLGSSDAYAVWRRGCRRWRSTSYCCQPCEYQREWNVRLLKSQIWQTNIPLALVFTRLTTIIGWSSPCWSSPSTTFSSYCMCIWRSQSWYSFSSCEGLNNYPDIETFNKTQTISI